MKFLDRVASLFARKSDIDNSLDLFREIYGGRKSLSGVTLTLEAAMRCATAMACARVIATGIALPPLKLFRDQADGGKAPAVDHPLYRLLFRKPNPWQTSYELRETIGLHLAFCGRAYVFKTIVRGVIRELIPFEPGRVRTELAEDGVKVLHHVTGKDGKERTFDSTVIWHLKGPSWNGWEGLDAMNIAREAVGLSIAIEQTQSRMYANGVVPSGVYSVDAVLDDKGYKQLRKFLAENYAGDNQGLPMIVDRSAKWLQTSMKSVDAETLDTRKYVAVEVCRQMQVMPIMVFADDRTQAFASVEAMYDAHDKYTNAAWWARIEQSIDCNLLTDLDERDGVYARFIGQALLRGSVTARADYFSKALGAGGSPAWMTQDEVRKLEEMNPMGGDAALLPKPTNVPKLAPPTGKEPAGA